jgi:hypothetical protein
MKKLLGPFALALMLLTALSVAVAQDSSTTPPRPRVERARELTGTLLKLKVRLKREGKLDELAIRQFDQALDAARVLAQPITAAELTQDEKDSLQEEFDAKKSAPKGGWLTRMTERLLETAFEGVDLSQDERDGVSELIADWYRRSFSARKAGDSKRVSDLKRERDKELRKLIGNRDARRVITNLTALAKGK